MEDNEHSYYCPSNYEEFPLTPELQQEMDDVASRILLAMSIAEELGLNDFGKAQDPPQ